jgi:hypothetical protein
MTFDRPSWVVKVLAGLVSVLYGRKR